MTPQSTLLAFDFDGTLAPIGDDPAAVQMHRAAATLIEEASDLQGVVVAIVSGRDVDDLLEKTNARGAYLVGSHGLEMRGPGGTVIRDTPPLDVALPDNLIEDIERASLRLERKKHAVALHWRGVQSNVLETMIVRFRSWARSADLDIIEGRCVVEARCRGGGKEEALRWVAGAIGASRVVYAGDDITDFGALRFAAEHGLALFVASSERVPPPGVTVVESFRELFRAVRKEVMI